MEEVIVSLSVDELDCLRRLVKERVVVWGVRLDCAKCEIAKEYCRFEIECYRSLLKSLEV